MNDKVSEYTFDDIEIGFSKKFQVIITESLVKQFASVSGDYSPIHLDEQYAKSTTFKKRVVHGMLLASFLSRVDGMYLPGKHALYFSQNILLCLFIIFGKNSLHSSPIPSFHVSILFTGVSSGTKRTSNKGVIKVLSPSFETRRIVGRLKSI